MKPKVGKELDINIYRKFQHGKDGSENQYLTHNRVAKSPLTRSPEPDEISTFQELTHSIQVMQNRLKYIESAKIRNEKLLETTLQKTQHFLAARSLAEESNRKVVESRAREESQKSVLRSRAAELHTFKKRGLVDRTTQLRQEKTRLLEESRMEKLEIERKAREAQENEIEAKKTRILKLKGEKMTAKPPQTNPEKLSRRSSMFNLESHFGKSETRRRPNHSTNDKGSVSGLNRSKSRNG
jgi:hypothetical protein